MKKKIDIEQYWKDKALILSYMKRFQKAVKDFRKENNIPPEGIPRDERSGWYSDSFKTISEEEIKRRKGWPDYELLPGGEKFIRGLEELAADFNLDSRWYSTLFIHIVSGDKMLEPPAGASVSISPNFIDSRLPENEQIVTRIRLEIRKDTAIADIQNIWSKVKEYQRKMRSEVPKRRKLISPAVIKQYIKIREMEDNGFTHEEIAEKVVLKTYEDVSRFKINEIEKHFRRKPPMS